MKYEPTIGGSWTPFCRGTGSRHAIGPGEINCAECGAGPLTSETSDHMRIVIDRKPQFMSSDLVILCISCSDAYQSYWHLCRLVGA